VTPRRIEHFLKILAAELGVPARVYVTGAAAAALWGRVRPSLDVDLGIELRSKTGSKSGSKKSSNKAGSWDLVQSAIDRTVRLTGIAASAASDIDRWGMITLMDYRRTSRVYRRFGDLEVRLLDPATWAIGKLTRYLDPDIRDVTEVFRKQAVDAARAARIWGRALRASPASTAQHQFHLNVEDFLQRQGRAAWGAHFDAAGALQTFERAARIVKIKRNAK
jgi:hypothetical protein